MKKNNLSLDEISLGELDPKLCPGGTPRRDNQAFWEGGTIPWVKVSDTNQKFISKTEECINKKGLMSIGQKKIFPKGSILMSIIGTIGNVSRLEIDAAISQSVIGIHIDDSKILGEYLLYYLDFIKSNINERAQEGTHKNMNTSMVKNIKIKYPKKISVQKNYISVLNKISKLRVQRYQTIELSNDILLSIFLKFFGDPVNNRQSMKPSTLKKIMLGKLQNGLFKKDSYYGKGTKIAWVENINPFSSALIDNNLKRVKLTFPHKIKTKNGWEVIDTNSEEKLYEGTDEKNADAVVHKNNDKKFLVKKDDILITRSSHLGKEGVGVMNVCNNTTEDISFESHIMKMTPNKKLVNPYYLTAYFKTKFARTNMYVKEGNMTSIDQPEVEDLEILLPPIDLQNKFQKSVEKIEYLISKQVSTNTDIDNLEYSIYKKLLN